MRRVFYIASFVCLSLCLSSQKAYKDSLLKIIQSETDDSIKCSHLFDFIESETNNKVWPKYNEQMKSIAKKAVLDGATGTKRAFYLKMYSEGIVNDGFLKQTKNDFQGALIDYRKALEIKLDIGDRKGVANALINMGYLFQGVANYSVAFNYYNKALRTQEEVGDKGGAATTMVNLASIFIAQKDTESYIKYIRKAVEYRKEIEDKNGLANCYNSLAVMLCQKKEFKEAEYLLTSALRINEDMNNLDGIGHTLNNLGGVYLRQGKNQQAHGALKNALDVNKKIGDENGIATAYRSIAEVFYMEDKTQMALSQYKLAYKHSQLGGGLAEQSRITRGLSNSYRELGDKKRAKLMMELSRSLQDSVSRKVDVTLEDIEFNSEIPEGPEAVLESKIVEGAPSSSSNGFLVGVVSTLIVLAAIAIYRRKGRLK